MINEINRSQVSWEYGAGERILGFYSFILLFFKMFSFVLIIIFFNSFIHMCILFGPFLPCDPHPLPLPPTPLRFQADPVLPFSPILLKRRHKQ
jgi:hypothetical protein